MRILTLILGCALFLLSAGESQAFRGRFVNKSVNVNIGGVPQAGVPGHAGHGQFNRNFFPSRFYGNYAGRSVGNYGYGASYGLSYGASYLPPAAFYLPPVQALPVQAAQEVEEVTEVPTIQRTITKVRTETITGPASTFRRPVQ